MADTLASTITSSSPYTEEQRRSELERRRKAGLAAAVGAGAESDAPVSSSGATPNKEPTETGSTAGSPLSGGSPGEGGSSILANTTSRVNQILTPEGSRTPDKPNPRQLRDAVSEYERAVAELKQTGADTTAVDAALADAKQAYESKASRNEMLGVVQLVAQAVAKLAAYQYEAKEGRYIADQVNVPSVDYEKRTDRALDEYKLATGEAEKGRNRAERESDRDYSAQKDRSGSLRERIGSEERIFGNDTAAYSSELANVRANERAGASESAADARARAAEEAANRRFGKQDLDNAEQELSSYQMIEKGLQQKTGSKSKVDLDQIAQSDKVGITADELDQIKQTAADADEYGGIPEKQAVDNAVKSAILAKLKPKLDALRTRMANSREVMRTGKLNATPSAAPNGDETGKKIRAKATGEIRPYTDALWKQIQASDKAADFELTGQ